MHYRPPLPPPHRPGVPGGIVALIAGVCLGIGLFSGCAAGYGIASAPATPAAAAPTAEPTAPPASAGAASADPSTSPSASPPTSPTATSSPARKIVVPNVVGMNHQEAQDLLQARGLYGLQEQDATGQGRMLVWDRNWVVVRQTPKGGTRVTEDQTITLYSKKIGE